MIIIWKQHMSFGPECLFERPLLPTCGTMLRIAAVESLESASPPDGWPRLLLRLATCSCSHTNVTRKRKTAVRRQDEDRRRPNAGAAIATRNPRPAAKIIYSHFWKKGCVGRLHEDVGHKVRDTLRN